MVCLIACALYTFDVLLALNNVRDKTFFFTNHKTQTAALIFFPQPSFRHQFTLRGHGYATSSSRGVLV